MKFLVGLAIAAVVAVFVVLKLRKPAEDPPTPEPGSWEPAESPAR